MVVSHLSQPEARPGRFGPRPSNLGKRSIEPLEVS